MSPRRHLLFADGTWPPATIRRHGQSGPLALHPARPLQDRDVPAVLTAIQRRVLTLTATGYLPIRAPPWGDFKWTDTTGNDDAVEKAPAANVPLFDAAAQRPDKTENVRQLARLKATPVPVVGEPHPGPDVTKPDKAAGQKPAAPAQAATPAPASATPPAPVQVGGDHAAESVDKAEDKSPRAGRPAAGKYMIKIKAFRNEDEAETFLTELRARGYTVSTSSVDVADKGQFFRVRMGPYGTIDSARAAQRKFLAAESHETILIATP